MESPSIPPVSQVAAKTGLRPWPSTASSNSTSMVATASWTAGHVSFPGSEQERNARNATGTNNLEAFLGMVSSCSLPEALASA